MKIAMWSGPRNLSTAMMYSFAARGDCAVWDEPFYAAYLRETASDHPMAHAILAAHEADPARVAKRCSGPIPENKQHWYMKHMPHHMVDGMPTEWARDCVNVHLIRHPKRVMASYAAKRDAMTLEDIGFPQQYRIWRAFPGPVVDSADIRANPKRALMALCAEIGIAWTDQMLSWEMGPKSFDGVWAKHWYGAVHRSDGFAAAEAPLPDVPDTQSDLLAKALPIYEDMHSAALSF